MRLKSLSLLVLVLLTASSARAGIFDRKPKAPPQPPADAMQKQAERVYVLLSVLQSDKSDGKRGDAAEKLQDFDTQLFPEIVPTLAQAALKDSSASVRREAVKALGRIKPTSKEAAEALDQAAKDESYLVRWQARTSKLGYKVAEAPAAPAAPPPQRGQVIQVPPAGADGRLTPVPVPSVPPAPEARQPAVNDPPKPAKVTLSKPTSKPPAQEGPILVPPIR